MAFKKASSYNLCKDKITVDDSTKEILDYLYKSKKFFSDDTVSNLNKKISKLLKGRFVSSIKCSKDSAVALVTILSVTGSYVCSHNNAMSIPSELKQQLISVTQEEKDLTSLNLQDKIKPVSEQLVDSISGIKPGQPFMIIPDNLKVYSVKKGDTPVKISRIYNITLKKLISANPKVDFLNLKSGQKLVIPEIITRDHRYKLASRGISPSIGFSQDRYFRWPTAGVRAIVSPFGLRGARRHLGVDISGKYGETIRAAKPGVVTFAGWNGDYGQCIIIDHGYGIQTLYAHASQLLIKAGEYVDSGQEIAKIGTTGRATGPHLHFQVMLHGVPKDPEAYLRS